MASERAEFHRSLSAVVCVISRVIHCATDFLCQARIASQARKASHSVHETLCLAPKRKVVGEVGGAFFETWLPPQVCRNSTLLVSVLHCDT